MGKALSLLLLIPSLAFAQDITGKVVGVTDGDTLTVLDASKKQHKIRLHGIDAPESAQPFGTKAKQRLSELVFSREVRVEVKDTDRYGRTVGVVLSPSARVPGFASGNVNHILVWEGMAWWYRKYAPGDRAFQKLEQGARSRKVGIWSEGRAVAPWDWRNGGSRTTPVVPRRAPSTTKQVQTVDRTVYITRTGKKHHADGCRYLSRSQISIKLSEAQRIYDACSVCGGG